MQGRAGRSEATLDAMGIGFRDCLFAALLVVNTTCAWAQREGSTFRFSTPRYSIDLQVSFPAPYEGRRLVVFRSRDRGKPICLGTNIDGSGCMEKFVGAIAIVTFVVKRTSDGKPAAGFIRERVTLMEQSPGLPERPPFTMRVRLVNGVGSDVQAFGYNEGLLAESMRAAEREAAKTSWRRLHQELYMDDDEQPFSIVEWLHTITGIQVVRAHGEWQSTGERNGADEFVPAGNRPR